MSFSILNYKLLVRILLISIVIIKINSQHHEDLGEWWKDSKIYDLTDKNVSDVIGKDKYVFLDFYTKWCIWCKRMYDEYEKLYQIYKTKRTDEIVIAKLDCDASQQTTIKYGIFSFPFLALYYPNDGTIKKVCKGERTAQYWDKWLDENAPKLVKGNLKGSGKVLPQEEINNATNNPNNNLAPNGTEKDMTGFNQYFIKRISEIRRQLIRGVVMFDEYNRTMDKIQFKYEKSKINFTDDDFEDRNKIVVKVNPFIFGVILFFALLLLVNIMKCCCCCGKSK